MRDTKNGYIDYDYTGKTEKEQIAEIAWRSVFRWLCVIVGVLFVFFLCRMLFFGVFSVNGISMEPPLHDGDKIFVSTFNYTPKQGDIVVMGISDKDGQPLVKRVIALEKQVVDIDYMSGTVTVDGVIIDEAYISDMSKESDNEIEYPYTVPTGKVFVMGDNRNESNDSRLKSIGAVDEREIIGKALFRMTLSENMNIYG